MEALGITQERVRQRRRAPSAVLGPEASRMDAEMQSRGLTRDVRSGIWAGARHIIAHGPTSSTGSLRSTGIGIGYVQSGKTTSFTALIGLAADSGYRVVVAMLGSTNLLLEQNRARLFASLALESRTDYRWIHFENPSIATVSPRELAHYIGRGRLVLVTLLKHSGRIEQAARVLTQESVGSIPTLIVDDEADQVSLNTRVREGDESPTYAAIGRLRDGLGAHLYVQYTATPYAPLLLEVEDFLSPDFVEILHPGPGYVGGREIFVENRSLVVREITDAPAASASPVRVPSSLRDALGEFIAGAALLLGADRGAAPVSMLIHPSGRVDPQRRYDFLVERCLRSWRDALAEGTPTVDVDFERIRSSMVANGCARIPDALFAEALAYVLAEATIWRVNSDEDANRTVKWNVAPVHILIGGNKLDRGFTVEGLTVSWLGRPPSPQIDTMVQRARAYGYRARYLPYCRVYGSGTTLESLTSSVETELDMRARLRDWIDEGRPVNEWASDVGLIIQPGLHPTRAQVLLKVAEFRSGWHLMSRPSPSPQDTARNWALVDRIGLRAADMVAYGRLLHRTLSAVPVVDLIACFVDEWSLDYSPGWDRRGLRAWLMRLAAEERSLPVVLMAGEGGVPRERAWDDRLGFEQLMQGRDPKLRTGSYPGDREILPGRPHFQVHSVRARSGDREPRLALAAYVAGAHRILRRESSER